EWLHRLVLGVGDRAAGTDVEQAPALVAIGRQARVLAKHVGRPAVSERVAPAHRPGDFLDDPPARLRLARRRRRRGRLPVRSLLVAGPPVSPQASAGSLTWA